MSEEQNQIEFLDSIPSLDEDEESNVANASMPTWDHARFLLEQGKTLYHSWTSTDAGLLEFQAARQVVEQVGAHDLLLDATLWVAHAHLKLKQYEAAAQNYFTAIRMMEQQQGMYSHATEQAYLWLSKALGDSGDTSRSLQAALTAARIEHFLAGPIGPHKSRALLQQTLHKEYQYSAVEIAAMWSDMKDSIHWELEGDRLLTAHDHDGAFRAYEEAGRVERLQWGFQDNLRLMWLRRKAALVLLEPTELMSKIEIVDCPTHCHPLFCEALSQGDVYYLGKYSPGMATDAYSKAIGAFAKENICRSEFQPFLFVIGFLMPLVWFLFRKSTTQCWANGKGVFAEAFTQGSKLQETPECVTSGQAYHEVAPKIISTGPPSPELNPLAESAAGQEILAALEGTKYTTYKYQDDVAASVESLGRVLAGFETHMELDHDDLAESKYHCMSPIE